MIIVCHNYPPLIRCHNSRPRPNYLIEIFCNVALTWHIRIYVTHQETHYIIQCNYDIIHNQHMNIRRTILKKDGNDRFYSILYNLFYISIHINNTTGNNTRWTISYLHAINGWIYSLLIFIEHYNNIIVKRYNNSVPTSRYIESH